MIQFDNSQAAFNPPSLHFAHEYTGAILVFDDLAWGAITNDNTFKPVRSQTGKVYENFRECKINNQDVLFISPNTGAPAAVIDFELLIASGIRKFVAFGTCGVFDANIPQNSIIVPTFAVREEGVSYHYLPADVEVEFSSQLVAKMLQRAQQHHITAQTGGIWTTGAVYRETVGKIEAMRSLGCIGVDMELSALMAVAQYRRVDFAQFLIVDDLVSAKSAARKVNPRKTNTYLELAVALLDDL